MRTIIPYASFVPAVLGLTLLSASVARASDDAQDSSQALFRKVFGEAVALDPEMVAKVKAGKPGERFYVDRNGDGKNDEVWFIDRHVRHQPGVQPLLVRAIDENGDLDEYLGPDLDSDLYVVDFNADGTVDVVLDYHDVDGDGDVDEMAFYFHMKHHPYFGDDVLRVWWGRDDGDDNLLWYDVNYNYYQNLCQYRCHFSGDESFVAFGLLADSKEWLSAYENPFLFYDLDGDDCSEVTLRIEGQGNKVRAIRYSFDADDDADGRRTHDYDFSITARAAEDKPVILPEHLLISTELSEIPTQGWLDRQHAREFVTHARWEQALLTWDEMNANTEQNVERDPHERWEGVIAHGSKGFRQVGGPPCSRLNKRNELRSKPRPNENRLELYYDSTDRKLHLDGAEEGWLDIDYNFDGQIDARYTWHDDDGDGRFDRRQIDVDDDGTVDFEFKMNPQAARTIELEYRRLMPFYKLSLPKILDDSQTFLDAARMLLPDAPPDPAQLYFENELASWMPQTHLGAYIRKSPAGQRFYMDLIRDRALAALKKEFAAREGWATVERLYGAGDYRIAAQKLIRQFGADAAKPDPRAFGAYTRRIALQLDNTGTAPRMDWPVVIPLGRIREAAPDFNPDHCAVVDGHRWIQWRQLPHQVDEVDPAVGPELTFIADLPGHSTATYYVYYSPADNAGLEKGVRLSFPVQLEGAREENQPDTIFARRAGTAEDWVPPNIGWESNRCAYRAYWGQFDFFGKQTEQLIYDDIGARSYHTEVEWGIDALHVGTTSGIGGLTLYVEGKAWPVRNPAGKGEVKFTKRQLVSGPVRAAVEITASNIVPDDPELTVRMICIIHAERQETEVRTAVTGGQGEAILAPGLVKLPREDYFENAGAGVLGSWGWQEEIISDIGMAVMAPPESFIKFVDLPEERQMQCRTTDGQLRYWLIGDWRRGRQHPVAPTIDNWRRETTQLAGFLNKNLAVTISAAEELKN